MDGRPGALTWIKGQRTRRRDTPGLHSADVQGPLTLATDRGSLKAGTPMRTISATLRNALAACAVRTPLELKRVASPVPFTVAGDPVAFEACLVPEFHEVVPFITRESLIANVGHLGASAHFSSQVTHDSSLG